MKKRNKKKKANVGMAILVGFGLIAFWRGIWGLMDLYLFPARPEWSFWASLIVGLVILSSTHYLVRELIGSND